MNEEKLKVRKVIKEKMVSCNNATGSNSFEADLLELVRAASSLALMTSMRKS